ncbi:hydrogenase subunit MbhD domain-containing protein, partial [Methylophaga sp. UBA5113]|uniref:hydrogenase subunit MbhD domain-containing protein n=3 Tax=Methylophaga TaxID=40222 RepID=UPI0025DCCEC8
MLAGAIDHEIGTKDLTLMGGLRSNMPRTALITALAALSLAGMPPLFGFIAKEAMFEAVLGNDNYQVLLLILALAAAMLVMAIAAVVAIKPFYGELRPTSKKPHEAPMAMLIGPSILAVLSLIFGLLPWVPQNAILSATVNAISVAPASLSLALWHGFNLPLLLSVIALAGGILLFMVWQKIRPAIGNLTTQLSHYGPEAGYFGMMNGITGIASWQTRLLQNGKLGNYMIVMILTTVILVGYTLLSQYGLNVYLNVEGVAFYELSIALLMLMATLYAIYTPSRLGAVASMGVLGFTVALVFIHFSAPDLGITQVLVETLTVILLILVLFKLPGFSRYSSRYEVIRDA